MTSQHSNGLDHTVDHRIVLRQSQIEQLSLYYSSQYPNPACLVVNGPEETKKTETTTHVLDQREIEFVALDCKECLSQRHLLTKIFSRCLTKLAKENLIDRCDRLDNINALASNLRKLFVDRKTCFVLLLDNADRVRGGSTTLLPALSRLGDIVPHLSVIFTSSSPHPLALHRAGVPYVHFLPYQRDQAIQILLQDPPSLLPETLPSHTGSVDQTKLTKIYGQFATVIYDTLISPTSNSIAKYRQTCERLWPRFIWPMLSGELASAKAPNVDWDFARLLARNRILFQAEGEHALQERLIHTNAHPTTFDELIASLNKEDLPGADSIERPAVNTNNTPLLKYLATLLLLAAYLASHTHPRHDIVLFSRLSNASSTNRRKKKYLARSRAGGITKTPTKSPTKKSIENGTEGADIDTPKKQKASAKEVGMETATPKKERADRSMRAIFEKTSNIAKPFTLERVVAILRAIHPDGVKTGKGVADRIYAELGELEKLQLVIRADSRSAGRGDAEGIMEEKWKCLVGRDWVVEAGKCWNLSIEGWEVE